MIKRARDRKSFFFLIERSFLRVDSQLLLIFNLITRIVKQIKKEDFLIINQCLSWLWAHVIFINWRLKRTPDERETNSEVQKANKKKEGGERLKESVHRHVLMINVAGNNTLMLNPEAFWRYFTFQGQQTYFLLAVRMPLPIRCSSCSGWRLMPLEWWWWWWSALSHLTTRAGWEKMSLL